MGEKKKILHITGVLPLPQFFETEFKEKDNDYLFEVSDELETRGYQFSYIRTCVYSNCLLAKLKPKWKIYSKVPRVYEAKGHMVRAMFNLTLPGAFGLPLTSRLSLARYRSDLKQYKDFSLIHAQYIYPAGLYAYYLHQIYNIPYVLTLRRADLQSIESPFTRGTTKKILQNAAYITCPSFSHGKLLEEKSGYTVHPVSHGIRESFLFSSVDVNKVPVINVVARLYGWKRIDLLLDALADVKGKYTLNIIGDGECMDDLKRQAEKNSIPCDFKGFISNTETIDYLKRGDIFVLPSGEETLGRAYLEALATSNAVIGVKNSGVWGYVDETAMLFMEKDSVESLRTILQSLLDNHEQMASYKKKGYESVANGFTWKAIADEYEKSYEQAMMKEGEEFISHE